MSTQTNAPKVFISYSWEPIQNKQKVLELAERLSTDGVHVTIDVWDLEAGQNKYAFMEKMVFDPDIKKVLLICNKQYADKANTKQGGVGTESAIVSPEIYSKVEQTKFIPIIFETENGVPCCPIFAKSSIYYDLCTEEIFESEYQNLIRNIFGKPLFKRPALGVMPSYLINDEPILLATAYKVNSIKQALLNNNVNTIILIKDYLNCVISEIERSELIINDFPFGENTLSDYDEIILNRINNLIHLRSDFENFIIVYLDFSVCINKEILHDFFERLIEYCTNTEGERLPSRFIGNLKGDSWKFLIYELFLVFTATLIQKEKFEELAYIIYTPFVIKRNWEDDYIEIPFHEFNRSVRSINDSRKQRLNLNRVNIVADTIKQRMSKNVNFDKMVEADLLLYYISILFPLKGGNKPYWFPQLSCYGSPSKTALPKTISKKYFDKAKVLLRVNSKEDLQSIILELISCGGDKLDRGWYKFPLISHGLQMDKVCQIS